MERGKRGGTHRITRRRFISMAAACALALGGPPAPSPAEEGEALKACLYGDGTLVVGGADLKPAPGRAVDAFFGDYISACEFGGPWRDRVEEVEVLECRPASLRSAFAGLSHVHRIDLSAVDGGACLDASSMLAGCEALRAVDLGGLSLPKCTTVSNAFGGCSSLERVDLSGLGARSLLDASALFSCCEALAEVVGLEGLADSSPTNLSMLFCCCDSLRDVDVTPLDTSRAKTLRLAFFGCSNLERLDVSGFDTSSCFEAVCTFASCYNLGGLDVSGFDTSEMVDLEGMFAGWKREEVERMAAGFDFTASRQGIDDLL